jgi:glycosyltransferase involved in cell wall biosynthesis
MRVAFVIAAFNAETTIGGAIDSVLLQGCDDWEIVVVDDGSTDSTLNVAMEYSSRDDRIRVLRQENAGAGAARNAAISVVDSGFTAYLDADDTLAADYLTTMLRLMCEYPGRDIYSCDGLFVHEDGSTSPVFGYRGHVSMRVDDLLRGCAILGGGALVRTEALRALGGFRGHLYGEDYDLWLRAIASGHTHIASPEPLYVYHRDVHGQKSKDFVSGYGSAVAALTDLIDSGLLTPAQVRIARESIANNLVGPRLEQQAQSLRRAVEKVAGERLTGPVMRVIHAVAWVARPLRRLLAGKGR